MYTYIFLVTGITGDYFPKFLQETCITFVLRRKKQSKCYGRERGFYL